MLTELGRVLLHESEEPLSALQVAIGETRTIGLSGKQRLLIGYAASALSLPIARRIHAFWVAHASTEIALTRVNAHETADAPATRRIDAFIGHFPIKATALFSIILLAHHVVTILPRYFPVDPEETELVFVNKVPLIACGDPAGFFRAAHRQLKQFDVESCIVTTGADLDSAMELVEAGSAATLVPEAFIVGKSVDVRLVNLKPNELTLLLVLSFRERDQLRQMTDFIDALADKFP